MARISMSRRRATRTIILGLCIGSSLLFCGCRKRDSVASELRLAGVYRGIRQGFRETIILHEDQTFVHEVVINGEPTINETGRWWYANNERAAFLEPFTSFADINTRTIVSVGTNLAQVALFPLPTVGEAKEISPFVGFEFKLQKVGTDTSVK